MSEETKEMEELEESEVTETEEVTEADKSTAKVTKHSGEDDAKKNPDIFSGRSAWTRVERA